MATYAYRTHDVVLESSLTEARKLESQLRDRAIELRDRMDRLVGKLDDGNAEAVNSSGEVQHAGSEIDRLCAELAQARKTIERIEYLIQTNMAD